MAIIVESFEGLTATPNSPEDFDGFLTVGATGTFEFESGVRLTAPIPNNDPLTGALVGDFALGPAAWLFTQAPIDEAGDVPDGSAFIARSLQGNGTLEFTFDTPAFTVGALVNAEVSKIGIAAYSASGKLISGARINEVTTDGWETNFLQVTSKKPIAKVVFTGSFVALDELAFDTDKPEIVNGTKGKDKLEGSDDDNLIISKKGNDKVFAEDGDDTVDGGAGKDKLHGGDDNDTLMGGKGNFKDKLWGDEGQDSFLFNNLGAIDTVKDFSADDDNILLARSVFTVLGLGELAPEQFGATASTPEIRITYEAGTGILSYDSDGNGGTAAIAFAKLSPGLTLTAEHFFVV